MMGWQVTRFAVGLAGTLCLWAPALCAQTDGGHSVSTFLDRYCLQCHDSDHPAGNLDLSDFGEDQFVSKRVLWERIVHKLNSRQMPPKDVARPSEAEYQQLVRGMVEKLDGTYWKSPEVGRTEGLRRMNRVEYQNSIRDLLGLRIDAGSLLPPDEVSGSFDNITVTNLSPTLLNRYIAAAQRISHMAIAKMNAPPQSETFRVKADITQEGQMDGLPAGTRGGTLIQHHFTRPGTYEIQVRLARDRNEEVEGLLAEHQLVILVDRKLVHEFTISPPKDKNHSLVDAHLIGRVEVPAGLHQVAVTFRRSSESLVESKREPYAARFNMHRHPRLNPAVFQVTVTGPETGSQEGYQVSSPIIQAILGERLDVSEDSETRASRVISQLIRIAYRRPIEAEDLALPMEFFRRTNATAGFYAGLQAALESILVSPSFLFRLEREPPDVAPGTVYPISDFELASRLSYFLWSSLPDAPLLDLAEQNRLHVPEILKQQTRRMLADKRARNLVDNFASQWLYLRNLDSITPDLRLFPDFDDNLRQAFRQETEMLFEHIWRDDRSVMELIRSDFTFLNERLARHYGIEGVYGARMRRVDVAGTPRGGLLRHGSILTVTSYATRTSPVIRGQWILKNILGAPPPPPPADVPTLKDKTIDARLSIRDRLAEHRAQPACASCHNMMDPIGFTLENFDAVGRWRESEFGQAIDASGETLDGTRLNGVEELEQAILMRSDLFVANLVEKLMTFGLGRGMAPSDTPALRKIVRDAEMDGYRFSDLIVGITRSPLFTKRTTSSP